MGADPMAVDPDLPAAVNGLGEQLDSLPLPFGRGMERLAINRSARLGYETFHFPVGGHLDRTPFQTALIRGKILGGSAANCQVPHSESRFFLISADLGVSCVEMSPLSKVALA